MSIAATNDIAIEYRDACKTYGPKTVLDHLSLKIPRGAFVTMIGTSGSGKTTALKMVNRLIEPTSGTVLVDGCDVRETDPIQLRRNIGYAIQGSVLFPHMTVLQNMAPANWLFAVRFQVQELSQVVRCVQCLNAWVFRTLLLNHRVLIIQTI